MVTVKMIGWKEGLEKVSLTNLQTSLFSMSLKEAKENVDKLLDNKEVTIDISSKELAEDFIIKVSDIGVTCELSN